MEGANQTSQFRVQTTELGIPLGGIAKVAPAGNVLFAELSEPFSILPAEHRLHATSKGVSPDLVDLAAPHLLRTIFRTIIHIHQNSQPASDALKACNVQKATLEEQMAALREQKQLVIKGLKAEKKDSSEKYRLVSSVVNEMGKVKQELKKLDFDCFEKIFPTTIDACHCKNFVGYITNSGQYPDHMKEISHLTQLIMDRESRLQKSFVRGWELLVLQLKKNRPITRKELCSQLSLSAAEGEEFLSKLAWICRKHNFPALEDVVLPEDDTNEKLLHGPVKIKHPGFPPISSKMSVDHLFAGIANPFDDPKKKVIAVINH